MYQRHITGRAGEDQAADYLTRHGYRILERNWQKKIGEIDIIAKKDGIIYFFEVKTRSGLKYGHPFHAIGRRKRQLIRRLGLGYVTWNQLSYSGLAIGAIGIINKELIFLPIVDKF
jgi:putative endonuclease